MRRRDDTGIAVRRLNTFHTTPRYFSLMTPR
jgi:hypothetical protein